ncbi:MAG: hypothetical protein KIT11_04625 [Fimbriimonadaceae bacterium]|nr:hypothetical protein [Fimbriimonadaceae bacterium]QYK56821.1 MAG: hypothetical protein KF733_04900 [Fimbriimonadaceae bacterium]
MSFRSVIAASLCALATLAAAQVQLSVNVKEGDSISGEFNFLVTVQSNDLVTSVEFYVGDDLRGTDSSRPYEFKLDTLAEEQGPLTVTFAAYTEKGASAKQTYRLQVDNGIEKGIDFQIEEAQAALADSKWEQAIGHGRIALKIDPKDNRARLVMARANMGLGAFDIAQKYVEDAAKDDPKSAAARDLLSAVHLRRAFATFNRSGDRMETVASIGRALKAAAESRAQSHELTIDAIGEPNNANRLRLADALIEAGRYSRAISMLEPAFRADFKNTAVGNRLLYAQLRAVRLRGLAQTMKDFARYGAPDGSTYAIQSAAHAYLGDVATALEMEKEAILSDPASVTVKSAQTYLALKRRDTKTMANLASDMLNVAGQSPVVQYDLAALYFLLNRFDEARNHFESGLLAEPASWDLYIERANQAIAFAVQPGIESDEAEYQRSIARAYLDAAAAARPESFEVLTGLTLVNLMDGKTADAVRTGNAAVAAGPDYAAAHYAQAAALFAAKQSAQATQALKKAGTLDQKGLEGRPVPDALTAWRYFFASGRVPYLAPPGV